MIFYLKSNRIYPSIQWLGNNLIEIQRFQKKYGSAWRFRAASSNLYIYHDKPDLMILDDDNPLKVESGEWVVAFPGGKCTVVCNAYVQKYLELEKVVESPAEATP